MKAHLILFILSSFYLNVSYAGICKILNGYSVANAQKTSYGGCLKSVIDSYTSNGKSIYAIYEINENTDPRIPDTRDPKSRALKGSISVSSDTKITFGPPEWTRATSGCFASAKYRNFARATFASAYGKILNTSGSTLDECLRSGLNAFTMEISKGESLNRLNLEFLLEGKMKVSASIFSDVRDASSLKELLNQEVLK